MGLINTVLGYKKGSKTKNIFSISENMMFELSNALSIVFISLKLVKLRQVKVLSVAPPKGHETLQSCHFRFSLLSKMKSFTLVWQTLSSEVQKLPQGY